MSNISSSISIEFRYPSTRYYGSKRRLLDWIWENVKDIKFDSVIDVFGGTGSIGLMFKRHGKRVYFNDILKFNQIIGKAIIENKSTLVEDKDLESVLNYDAGSYSHFISSTFAGIFFLDYENEWLDRVITNISFVSDEYKRAILQSALFQSCLVKRPFNLFHRANLYMRTANVSRTFGNKTTWETPFDSLLKKFVYEYNQAVFDNGKPNIVIGGYDALEVPYKADLVYLDPPYFALNSGQGTNYLAFYHFLEGLADYSNWGLRISGSAGKIKRIGDTPDILRWTQKTKILDSFDKLIERFQESIIVLSYQNNGVPTKDELVSIFKKYKKNVNVHSKPFKYVLSSKEKEELLFIAR